MAFSSRQVAAVVVGAALLAAGLYFAWSALQSRGPPGSAACGGTIAEAPSGLGGVTMSSRFVAWSDGASTRVHDLAAGQTRAVGASSAALAGDLLAYRGDDGRVVVENLTSRAVARLPAEAAPGGAVAAFDGRFVVVKDQGAWSAWDVQRNASQRVPADGLLAGGRYAYWNGGEVVLLDLDAGQSVKVALPAPASDFDGATLVALHEGRVSFARVGGAVETLALPEGQAADGSLRVDGERVAFASGARWVVVGLDGAGLHAFGTDAGPGDLAGNRTAYVESPAAGPSRVTLACLD